MQVNGVFHSIEKSHVIKLNNVVFVVFVVVVPLTPVCLHREDHAEDPEEDRPQRE